MFIGALCAFGISFVNAKAVNDFKIGEGTFLLNGQPFVVKAAELHYPRIPMEYWDQRIKMCKALGMNTVCLYTFWNVHEENESEFNFTGKNDIAHFIRLCQKNDMFVILRPGPYVCAEWEMGGLPWWLLKKKDISLRDNDPYFMDRVKIFEEELSQQLTGLLLEDGGPIIMIQVENEYGAYGENKNYVSKVRDLLRKLYGENILMFQCDWSSNFELNGLDDLMWTMNFGTGADIDSQFSRLKELRPTTPLMCSEFWSGWFDKWGSAHETRPAEEMIKGIDEMLSKGISFSLYMTHGGTNWGHWAGANSPGYAPDVTSYDYDAPINEYGYPTEKYWLLRETMQRHSKDSLPELPELIKPIEVDTFYFSEVAPLWDNMPQPIECQYIKTMEEFGQGYGSMLYRTTLPKGIKEGAILHIIEPHDYAQVFVDGKYIGKLDRRLGETEIELPSTHKDEQLDILVEGMGRINFGVAIKDFKGITENVYFTETVDDVNLTVGFDNWEVYLLPDSKQFYENMTFKPLQDFGRGDDNRYPRGLYRGYFHVDYPSDTFLNFDTWGKGLVFVNGYPLGRIWDIGPQQTLYTPGCWLKEGQNEILVFDILGPTLAMSSGCKEPELNKLQGSAVNKKGNFVLDLGNLEPVFGGAFPQKDGWQRQMFDHPVEGRYIIIDIKSPFDSNEKAAIAEIYALGTDGQRLSRENWKVVYSDSEDMESGNHSADKIFDLQESTFWQASSAEYPQKIVIDMSSKVEITGFEYLPRVESGAPGAIKEYQIYLTDKL